jgi:putative oxidoreductase
MASSLNPTLPEYVSGQPAQPATQTVSLTTARTSVLSKLISTDNDGVATVARIALGAMILPHGAQKLLGAFGGYGFTGTMSFFTETLGIPYVFALLAIVAEFFGGLGLITGLLGRVAALGVGATLTVAAIMSHLSNGFFMNWGGQYKAGAEGWEFHLVAVALAVVVAVRGSGALSIDRLLTTQVFGRRSGR